MPPAYRCSTSAPRRTATTTEARSLGSQASWDETGTSSTPSQQSHLKAHRPQSHRRPPSHRILSHRESVDKQAREMKTTSESAVAGQPRGWVGRAAMWLPWQLLFLASSRRTGLDAFAITRLSSDHGVNDLAACASWMRSWQVSQATTVLGRRSSMTRPVGRRPSGVSEVGKGADVMHRDITSAPADLAGAAESRVISSLCGIVYPDRPAVQNLRQTAVDRGSPPKRATSGFLCSRSIRALKQIRRPWSMSPNPSLDSIPLRAIRTPIRLRSSRFTPPHAVGPHSRPRPDQEPAQRIDDHREQRLIRLVLRSASWWPHL